MGEKIDAPAVDLQETAFSVNQLLAIKSLSPTFAERITDADTKGTGRVSIENLLSIVKAEHNARKQRTLVKKLLIMLGIIALCLAAAICGITFGIVGVTKQVKLDADNNIISKSTGAIVATGTTIAKYPVRGLYTSADVGSLASLRKLIYGNNDGSYTCYTITTAMSQVNVSTIILTASGHTFLADNTGLHSLDVALSSNGTYDISWYDNGQDIEGVYGEYYQRVANSLV